ncbi:6-phosphogluconolactonase [Govanella unica]|uniref:6-phosphogluconolactonase n=1 Tax=Govanella unica TaxID=2975056 RepID=A0A9X3Z7I8_9PROT|nr:6-phosphogluconolactonase [Govania unica]MDA5194206.1 6-phosphogluconolactonase [Govania unica]
MTEITWRIHADPAAMALAVAKDLQTRIERALAARDRALVVLPGGTTPEPIFKHLSANVANWGKVTIIPSDDRLVPRHDLMSNAGMLSRWFSGLGADVVPLVADEAEYKQAGAAADRRLHHYDWPPDFVWLGMGTDGHAASLFPGPDLDAALQTAARAIGVRPDPLPPEAPHARVTLSLSAIVETPVLMLVISGTAKKAVVERAFAEGTGSSLPVAHILAAMPSPVLVHWCP